MSNEPEGERVQALRKRLGRSKWIVCAEALRILDGPNRPLPGYQGFDDMRFPPAPVHREEGKEDG